MFDIVIHGGTVIFPDRCNEVDLAIADGKIAEIGRPGSFSKTKRELDAKGCYVFPGGIDPHVHVHWPFLAATTADSYAVASRAAALGGTTTFIDFAHPKMGPTPVERVTNRRAEVGSDSVLDFGLHCVLSDRTPETIDEMDRLLQQGITSFKLYMTYSRRKIMADDATLFFVMGKAAEIGALVCVHAENGIVEDALEAQFILEGKSKAVDFPRHKPNFIEAEAVERAIYWAKQTGAHLYIFHLSTKEGLEIIRANQRNGVRVKAETCPQYLLLDDRVFSKPGEGHRFICSPPIRSQADGKELWQGLKDGTISTIGTDHCAFTIAQKDVGIDNFIDVPNGLPGIETRLSLMWAEGVAKKRLSPEQVVNILSGNPAKIFGLFPRKGCIAIHSDADLVIFDPEAQWTLSQKNLHMGVDWSPYENWKMIGKVMNTIIRGELAVENGEYVGIGKGQFIARNPSDNVY